MMVYERTFLAGSGWGGFLYLGETGEPDERNDCPRRVLWYVSARPKSLFKIPIREIKNLLTEC